MIVIINSWSNGPVWRNLREITPRLLLGGLPPGPSRRQAADATSWNDRALGIIGFYREIIPILLAELLRSVNYEIFTQMKM